MDKNQKNNKPEKPDGLKINVLGLVAVALLLTVLINSFYVVLKDNKNTQVQYSQFLKLVNAGVVKRAQITSDRVIFSLNPNANVAAIDRIFNEFSDDNVSRTSDYYNDEKRTFYAGLIYDDELLPLLKERNVEFYTMIQNSNPIIDFIVSWILPLAIFYLLAMFVMGFLSKRLMGGEGGAGGFMGVGRSTAKLYNVERKTGVTFADFAGCEEAKESLTEIVDFLHSPEKYHEIGAKQPKGALLVGPPGTGKTLLAKAVAGEAGVPFFSLSGSEFVEMFVGVGASRVRDLFKQANKQAPCIIFIDEIDAIGKSRDSSLGGNDEREQTLNQLLAEMDGFDSSKGIIILGATNRPEILDKALLRPGRFDRRIIVEKPDLPGREAILAVHAKKVKTEGIDLRKIALATSGASGADLANMINEGALRAVKHGRKSVSQEDLMESVEVVIAGKEKKDRILSDAEKRIVAFHEVGHALASALQKNKQPVQKITIVPRTMGALGYVMNMPEEEKYIMTKDEILAEITSLLAGRAAEEIVFSTSSTGAANDIERATKLARQMISQYGMSDALGVVQLETTESRYLDGRNVSICSEATGAEIDREIRATLGRLMDDAKHLLNENRAALSEIAEYLIKSETITGEKFMEILEEIKNRDKKADSEKTPDTKEQTEEKND